jgi:flagellar secretion chaperone FliS
MFQGYGASDELLDRQAIKGTENIMMLNRRVSASYGDVMVESGVTEADKTQLIQMLLDGLIESLTVAEGHISRKSIAEKSFHLSRAGRIVIGLQSALDFEKGGDIAKNLNELYGYVTRRLLHINIKNDVEALREVRSLISQIREAWTLVPSLTAPKLRVM